jgi:predicted lipoprotein with Yx(FWY)xxD motif
MFKQITISTALATLVFAGAPALGQEAAAVKVAKSDEYGSYLTDASGRALYLFTADTQGIASTKPKVACSGDCLAKWPPLFSAGAPTADGMVNKAMIGTIPQDGKMMVTYNGWPLYYFFKDQGPGQTNGQDIEAFGGEWYLVSPDGEKVEED